MLFIIPNLVASFKKELFYPLKSDNIIVLFILWKGMVIMKKINRRNFLKVMGLASASLTLAACGGSSSTATSTAASTATSTAASAAAGDAAAAASDPAVSFSVTNTHSGEGVQDKSMDMLIELADKYSGGSIKGTKIAAGRLDAVAIARQNLVDHEWVHKIKEGRQDEIKPCIRCHNGCFNFAKYKGTPNLQNTMDSLHLGRCALNPTTMQHKRYYIAPTKKAKRVAIIGGGIGGMECALVLKQQGNIPVLFEKTNELGGLFLTASAMTFKENDKELIAWYKREIEKAGIEVHMNTEVNDLNTLRGFDDIIVATGSTPRMMPQIKGFEKTLTFTDVLKDKKEVGDKVLFIGGGQSSCEAAYDLLLNFGKHPIIVEYAGDLIAAQATCLANTSFLRDAMEYHKVPVYLHSTVTEITDKGCTVKNVQTGETFFVECDSVVNGIGFVPTPVGGKTASKKVKGKETIYRVGDCVAIGNLRTVIWRAWDVCMAINGNNQGIEKIVDMII